MSCARPSNFTLRRQKSLGCDCQPIVSTRERRLRLQKQYSVDQNRDTVSAAVHRSTNNNNNNNVHNVLKNGNAVNTLWNCHNSSPEASLRIFTAIKTKSQNHACETNEEMQRVIDNGSLPNKSRKKNEEKININIFLAHNVPELELGSDSESGVKPPMGKTKNVSDQNEIKPITNRLTAETRRSQFRQKSASLNETRPRLMRAMSAPIRPNPPSDTQDKFQSHVPNQNVTKRRLRRKKVAPSEIEPIAIKITHDQHYMNRFVSQRASDERSFAAVKQSLGSRTFKAVKPIKITPPSRAKSAINGCEIETLVSLLSPGGSDSEKEDYVNGNVDNTNERSIQSLRKVGKSVSFQDDESLADDPVLDLPSVLRRASLVPLASKIRINRPPTAPPSSIFNKSNVISDNSMSGDNSKLVFPNISGDSKTSHSIADSLGSNGGTEISKIPINIVNASTPLRKSSIDLLDTTIDYPEYVRSIKEKECWLLFQKMAKKGISVSYETILRGMLTPSEVRIAQKKQREITERQASLELESSTVAAGTGGVKTSAVAAAAAAIVVATAAVTASGSSQGFGATAVVESDSNKN